MTLRKSGLMLGLSTLALTMTACGWGDKSVSEEITVETPSLGLSGADQQELSEHFAIDRRAGTEAQTNAALSALGLTERDGITAESAQIEGSTVSYANWRVAAEDTVVTADQVVLTGLHMIDGEANFDKMEVMGLIAEGNDEGDEFRATLKDLIVIEPSPELAAELANVLSGTDADIADGAGLPDINSEKTFRALKLEGLTINVTESDGMGGENVGSVKIEQIVLGVDRAAQSLDAVIESVELDWFSPDVAQPPLGQSDPTATSSADERITLSMDGLTVLDFDTSERGRGPVSGVTGLLGMGLSSLSSPSLKAPYREADLGKLQFKTRTFDLDMDGFEARSERRGNVTEINSVLSPMVITLNDVSTTPLAQYEAALSSHGFEEITLKGSQTMTLDAGRDLVTVTDAKSEIDGGLRIDCNYSVGGTGAAQSFREASGISRPVYRQFETQQELSQFFDEVEAYDRMQAEANTLVTLNDLSCTVQDIEENSLVERGYAMASDVTGSPVAVMKGTAKTAIALGSLTAPTTFQRDLMDTVGSGLIKFLDKPGQTMTVRIDPTEPVSISALTRQPNENTLSALNLSVEVE